MDALSLLRTLGALLLVLGILVATLSAVKRHNLTMPGKWLEKLGNSGSHRRLQVVERLALDPRRSVVLLRRDDTEFSVLIGPEGVTVLDSAPVSPAAATDIASAHEPATPQAPEAEPEAPPLSFADRIAVLPDIWFTQDAKTELH